MKSITERSDVELIAEFQRGDECSFEELIARYSQKAYSLAVRLTRSEQDAEEVLQDVFVTVYRKIGGFEGKSSFSSWLYRVTVNASFMKLRKKRHDQNISIDEMPPELQRAPQLRMPEHLEGDNATLRTEVIEALELAIGELPEEYRPVFILRDVDGMTSKEVGKILEISVPAVKSRLHRSRVMVRRKLTQFYKEYKSGIPSDKSVGNL